MTRKNNTKKIAKQPASTMAQEAFSLHQQGKWPQALQLFDRALVQDSKNPVLHFWRGNTLRSLQQEQQALVSYDRALGLKPDYFAAHYNRANTLRDLDQPEQALLGYDQALVHKPDFVQAAHNRGVVLFWLKRFDEALASFERALSLDPNYEQAHLNRGNTLRALDEQAAAAASYERTIALNPHNLDAHYFRGNCLMALEHIDAALKSYDAALALHPDHYETLSNRGVALYQLERWDESLESFSCAIHIKPDYAEAYSNRGFALQGQQRWSESLRDYARALQIDPQHVWTNWNLSLCQLLLGDFASGWAQYEWRWKTEMYKDTQRHVPPEPWLGRESVQGKTILLHAEQGLGDTLQFCRYAALLKDRGARVLLETQPALASVLTSLKGVDQLITQGDPLPYFDYHCPLLSLPLAFGTRLESIPVWPSYLAADPERIASWSAKLGPKTKARVGLAWSGSTIHKNDKNRSLPSQTIESLLSIPVQLVSLQKEIRPADKSVLAAHPQLLDYSEELGDFADTAALIELMDVVISVDTSVAHLAGAMGKPVWVLLPWVPDWRWLLDREDSVWYPSARLFRQSRFGDWGSVVSAVGRQLRERFS